MMGSLRVAPAEEEDDARDSARLAEPADPEAPATPRSRVALEISARLSEQRDDDGRGSLLQKIRGALNEEYRRASTAAASDRQARSTATPLHREFHELVTRISEDGAREPAAVRRQVLIWQHKTFGRLPAQDRLRQYELLVGEVLPPFLG